MRVLLFLILISMGPVVGGESGLRERFVDRCGDLIAGSERTIEGEVSPWFFPTREIQQLSLGDFWEENWAELSRNRSEPVPSMIEFQELLAERGVGLFVVPIPAKATVYPDKLFEGFPPGEAQGLGPLIDLLRSKGLRVLDLEAHFISRRRQGASEKFWCAQDAHFSPMACVEVADLIAETLEREFAISRETHKDLFRSGIQEIEIVGDLVAHTEWEGRFGKERLRVRFVGDPEQPVESDVESPIVLLGDSHTLVFSEPGAFHCDGAGLFDHLSAAMGRPLDLVGNAAGGLVSSRINLYRKASSIPGYWDDKKVVVWVFTAREFTQSSFKKGFISVPIERK